MKFGLKFGGIIFLSILFFSSLSRPAYAGSCNCDGNLNVTWNNCGLETPVCGGHGSLVVCSCQNGWPTTTPAAPPIVTPSYVNQNYLCTNTSSGVGVNTAFGCVPVKLSDFIPWLLKYIFGIAGGIAFILMIYGFIVMITSSGDPKAVQGAKETITSAIIGLLVCIFSIFILRLITVDILHIPGIS